MAKKTYREVLNGASSFLEARGKEGYSILFVFLERKNWSKTDWLLQMNQEITLADEEQVAADLAQLLEDQPAQYLLGYADFYGQRFKVTPATLIPRPETEELVELCLTKNPPGPPLTVVDVGTGTGAIAISLKLARPEWQVASVDISPEALAVAQENAAALGAEVTFKLGDTLVPVEEQIDVLISNPPYISADEWALMDASVRTYEPKTALFAENNGLAIYQKLAEQAKLKLKADGQIFLEIGFRQGPAVQQLFQEAFPEKTVTVLPDLSGNQRMVYVR